MRHVGASTKKASKDSAINLSSALMLNVANTGRCSGDDLCYDDHSVQLDGTRSTRSIENSNSIFQYDIRAPIGAMHQRSVFSNITI